MFIIIMVMILGTCIAVLSSIYYNTNALQKTYWSVNSYYWAYYWAISSIERWLLMSKLKYPTYEWVWWFKWETIYWANSNGFSWEFWRLNQGNNSMIWKVTSKADSIKGYIDTKTIRFISFKKYTDSNLTWFTNTSFTDMWSYWIASWLEFSWTITLDTWEKSDTKIKNMDFNRIIKLPDPSNTTDSGVIIRSKRTNIEKEGIPLTWEFNFYGETNSPRPKW